MTDQTDGETPEEDYDPDYGGRARPRWLRPTAVAAIVALVGLGVGLGLALSGGSAGAQTGPEGVPIQPGPDLAAAGSTMSGGTVAGIVCTKNSDERDEYHIHVHLAVFVNGRQERVPAGAGIAAPRSNEQTPKGLFVDSSPGGCLYWLHMHSNDGILHVEAPAKQDFTLGQFFDVWGQPLGPDQVGPARGTVVAFLNGKRFEGNPRDIPLLKQAAIQLDVGTPVVPFKAIKFNVIGQCSLNCPTPPTS